MADREQEHRGGSGNFAEDRERASEAGKKGGQHSHGSQQHSQSGGDQRQQGGSQSGSGGSHGQQGGEHRGGSGNFAEDRERASEAGRKGGQH